VSALLWLDMRRLLPVVAALLTAAAFPAAASARSLQSVHVASCQTAADPVQRSAGYTGTMRAVPGAARMAMRFQLTQRAPGGQSVPVKGPGLSVWRTSHSGVSRFVYTQNFKGLTVGEAYRAAVSFRWYDSAGRTVHRAHRTSGSCAQDGALPNLAVTRVEPAPGASGTASYNVTVVNAGSGVARAFSVALIEDGALADSAVVESLERGESATVSLSGPSCHRLRVVVDREHRVPETVEEDNQLSARCGA
jgi:hypothetical protein